MSKSINNYLKKFHYGKNLPKIDLTSEIDKVWDSYNIRNYLDYNKIKLFYNHPVWILNGLFSKNNINVEYRSWKLSDYIKHHLYSAEYLLKKDKNNQSLINKQHSYQTLLDWMKVGKLNGFGDNGLLYILGPVKGSDKWLNQDILKDGDYNISTFDVEEYAYPFFNVMNEWAADARSREWYRKDVYQLFCCELYERFKNKNISLDICDVYFEYYSKLDKKEIPNKKSDVKDTFKLLDVKVDKFISMVEKFSK